MFFFFFFKQKTAYEMRISDWSSDVCSSDLFAHCNYQVRRCLFHRQFSHADGGSAFACRHIQSGAVALRNAVPAAAGRDSPFRLWAGNLFLELCRRVADLLGWRRGVDLRSEEHTSELQSLMRISYAVFCLKKK